LPELKEFLPELKETTRVRTRRGYHYYFSLNGERIKSTNHLFGRRLELKSDGNYVVAPPSIIKEHQYVYEVPLSKMLPIPRLLTEKEEDLVSYAEEGKHKGEGKTAVDSPSLYQHKGKLIALSSLPCPAPICEPFHASVIPRGLVFFP